MLLLKHTLALPLLAALFLSCESSGGTKTPRGSFYTPAYATGFCIDTAQGQKVLHVFNPFQRDRQHHYRYPIDSAPRRVVCLSTTHVALLRFIGHAGSIVGVASAGLVYDSALQARRAAGLLHDVGHDAQLNVERLLALRPDVIFAYGVDGELAGVAGKLTELGLRVVYLGEYIEQHPLGKAEWAVAVAAFFGAEDTAAQQLATVAREYHRVKALAASAPRLTPTLLNAPWGDAWFVPGQRSYMATLLRDAGGQSVVPLRHHRDSYPVSIEHAYRHAQRATCWLHPGQATSRADLSSMHPLLGSIPALTRGEVYNHSARLSPGGGNDFFESGTVNPHLILQDLIAILHPQLLPHHRLHYYRQLP